MNKTTCKITDKKLLTPTTIHLELTPQTPIEFLPGQFIIINHNNIKRSYSICNSKNKKNTIELCIRKLDNGKLSPILFNSKLNDQLEILGPFGKFTYTNQTPSHIYLIATGTGIAPIRGIIQTLQTTPIPFTLLFGNKFSDQIPYNNELEQLSSSNKNFTYHKIISREKSFNGLKGHIQDHLNLITNHDSLIYICGQRTMSKQVKESLLKQNFTKNQIKTEIFN